MSVIHHISDKIIIFDVSEMCIIPESCMLTHQTRRVNMVIPDYTISVLAR